METTHGAPNASFGRAQLRELTRAFNSAIARQDDVKYLFNHDANQVLGHLKAGSLSLHGGFAQAKSSKGLAMACAKRRPASYIACPFIF